MAMIGSLSSAGGGIIGGRSRYAWQPPFEALLLGSLTVTLALAGLLLVLVPQRIAQRPGRAGVIVVHLERRGGVRLWNQPIAEASLYPILLRASRERRPLRLRLVSDAEVPWGRVEAIAAQVRGLPLPLELQLP